MSYEGIIEIETTDSVAYANHKLASGEGWELLAITPSKEGPVYTLGRREGKKPMQIKQEVLDKAAMK